MKAYTTLGALALASLSSASQATTVTHSLSPTPSSFTASGSTTLSNKLVTNLVCTAKFSGTVVSGVATISAAAFTGGFLCPTVKPLLPWYITATGTGKANVTKVKVSAPLTGTCGPGTVPITATTNHITFTGVVLNPGACSVKGTITDVDTKAPKYITAK